MCIGILVNSYSMKKEFAKQMNLGNNILQLFLKHTNNPKCFTVKKKRKKFSIFIREFAQYI